MANINREMVLSSLIKHETLTVVDLRKKENFGIIPDNLHLNYLLNQLIVVGDVDMLNGVTPETYTITSKGIAEGQKLNESEKMLTV